MGPGWIKVRKFEVAIVKRALFWCGLAIFLMFGFQNCADPLDIADTDSLSYNSQLPFAFDTEIDTLAYMSCSGLESDFDPRAFFTFKAGAYGIGSGIRLTPEYQAATKNFTAGQRADSLNESEKNTGASLQFAVRQRNDIQAVLASSQTLQENRDFANILAPLDSPLIAERLVSLGESERISYFSGISGLTGRMVEAAVRFLDSEVSAASLRDNLRDAGLLALTYTGDLQAGGVIARSPDPNDRKRGFGKGYQVDFSMGLGNSFNSVTPHPIFTRGIHRVINSVQEVDLLRRSPAEGNLRPWDCPTENKFLIARSEDVDAAKVRCSRVIDPLTPSDKDRATLQAIRRVLRPEDWWVDLANRCVIPKQSNGNCYGRSTTQTPINIKYDGGDCTATGLSCPHYVSVCIRQ